MKECLVIEKSSRYNNASEISFQSSYPQIDDSIVARSHFVLISEVAFFFFPFFLFQFKCICLYDSVHTRIFACL